MDISETRYLGSYKDLFRLRDLGGIIGLLSPPVDKLTWKPAFTGAGFKRKPESTAQDSSNARLWGGIW